MADKLWTKEIMPALLMWAGTLADPWTISDGEFMRALRTVIQTIVPDFKGLEDIRPGKAIFYIVSLLFFIFRMTYFLQQASQRLCTWRSNFGSTAVAIIAHFLVSNKKIGVLSLQQVEELCSGLLKGLAVLYPNQDSEKPANLFQSCFVLYLLGHAHLRPCAGAPDIPELSIGDPKNTGIKGALALTCAAVCTIAF